jgi:ribose 5-phosphate isomerase A
VGTDPHASEKELAAQAAAKLVADGMKVGLGTGTTVAFFVPALARRGLTIRCVATSAGTEALAREHGLEVEPFEKLDRLDIAVDGADQVDPNGWIVKGGGGAHTREKIVAAAAERFVVIASSNKLVQALKPPVPVEILAYGAAATLRHIAPAQLRDAPPSPDGGLIADYLGDVGSPPDLAIRLACTPGVVDHGLFPPDLVAGILIGRGDEVERRAL